MNNDNGNGNGNGNDSKIEKKLAMLGITTSSIVHEIKSHVSIISGQAEILKESINQSDSNKEKNLKSIEKILNTSNAMVATIKNVQSLLYDTASTKQIIDLAETVFDALDYLNIRLEKLNIKTEFIEKFPGVQVFAQKGLITQVIINLISNSINAIREMEEKWVRIELDQDEDSANLKVIDSGSIPMEIRDSIFRPLFTTGTKGQSTGLGLFLISKTISDHNGKIELDEHAKNTTFSIQLPIPK